MSSPEEIDAKKKQFIFVTCKTKEHLHSWIKVYLNIDIPDCIVDPESTSSPMDMIWEVYDHAMKENDPDFSRVMYYASRDSFKTLAASILEVLALVHMNRDVAHLAAIQQQAIKCQSYVKAFLNSKYLRDYVVGNNITELWFVRHYNKTTGDNLPEKEYRALSETAKVGYEEIKRYIHIIVATLQSCNSEHVPYFCVSGDTLIPGFDISSPFSSKGALSKAEDIFCAMLASDDSISDTKATVIENSIPRFQFRSLNMTTHKWEYKNVVKAGRSYKLSVRVKCKEGAEIVCGLDHPLLTSTGDWEEAITLAPGDYLMAATKKPFDADCEIDSVTPAGRRWLYDFTVEHNHNYVSNQFVSHNCTDELDVMRNPQAYQEAKSIPCPRDGKMPITVLISTRKFSFGLVQKEIDEAAITGLKVRHWDIIDVTAACPPDRHRPDLPRLTIYRSDEELRHYDEANYDLLTPDKKDKCIVHENVFGGCGKCKLYPACRGHLATNQKSTSKLLKPIAHTINLISSVSMEYALAQYLCRKPSTQGLIYASFDRDIHMLEPYEIAEMATAMPHPRDLTKAQLISILKDIGADFFGGVDFGYTHQFVFVVGARVGVTMYILHVYSQSELEPSEQLEVGSAMVDLYDPVVFADPENPQMAKALKKKGVRIRKWSKGPGSVLDGINIVRMKLRPSIGMSPELYLLAGDPGCELLATRFSTYHWTTDAAGVVTNQPDKVDDDECDAARYCVMNVFSPRGRIVVPRTEVTKLSENSYIPVGGGSDTMTIDNWASNMIGNLTSGADAELSSNKKGRKGGFRWDI